MALKLHTSSRFIIQKGDRVTRGIRVVRHIYHHVAVVKRCRVHLEDGGVILRAARPRVERYVAKEVVVEEVQRTRRCPSVQHHQPAGQGGVF